jgi:hypothetical protein
MERTYRYFVLRYLPDAHRAEQVNIGLVVERDPIDIRITRNLRKAIAIDARRDAGEVLGLEQDVRHWIGSEKDFSAVRNALMHFGPITVSEPGWFKCTASAYEANVLDIMETLVVPRSRPRARLRSRLQSELRKLFQKGKLLGENTDDLGRHLVVPDFPVSAEESLFVDFALKNGVLHLTEAVDFRVTGASVRNEKFNEVGLKALVLLRSKQLYRRPSRYFVYAADSSQDAGIQSHLNLISPHADNIFNFASTQERGAYYDCMLRASGRNDLVLGRKPNARSKARYRDRRRAVA